MWTVDLAIHTRRHGPWMVIEVAGELDLHTSIPLQEQLSAAIEGGDSRLAVDLTGVAFMDSSSLGILVASLKRTQERGGDLAIVGVQGSPLKVLSLTGMDAVFTIVPTADELPTGDLEA